MRLTRTALMICIVGAPVLSLIGCGSGAKARSASAAKVDTAKKILADIRENFVAGRTERERPADARGGGRPDTSVAVVGMQIEKLRRNISKRVKNEETRKAAQAKLAEARTYFADQFMPDYDKARQSRGPDDAKALVPHVDQLIKLMDELLAIL